MEGWSNLPKMKLEIQEMCSTCFELRKMNELLANKCHIYERQIENLGKINAERGRSLQESQRKIAKQDQVVALLTQQIADNIAEISMLRVESVANNGGKVEESNCQLVEHNGPDIDKFLEIKMEIPNEYNLREEETNKEQDVERYSATETMEDSENTDDINHVFEEDEDEETEATLDEKQGLTCAVMVHDNNGTPTRCGRVFPSSKDLASHFRLDHLNADHSGIYVCRWDGCKRNGEPFCNRTVLLTHFRCHSGEKPYRCPFEGCNRAFAQITSRNSHTSSTHSNATRSNEVHTCMDSGCPKVFSRKGDMMAHYRMKHTGERRKEFACPVEGCGKVFGYYHVLRNHLNTHRPFQCPRCCQSFASQRSLDEHSETHEPVQQRLDQ